MSDHVTDPEERMYRAFVSDKLITILSEVQRTNGRVRRAEVAIAVLQVGYAVGAAIGLALMVWMFSKIPT